MKDEKKAFQGLIVAAAVITATIFIGTALLKIWQAKITYGLP